MLIRELPNGPLRRNKIQLCTVESDEWSKLQLVENSTTEQECKLSTEGCTFLEMQINANY